MAAVPITDAMKEVNAKYLEVTFYGINGIDENSRIYVDYIYAGPEWVVPDGHSYNYALSANPTATETGTLTGTCSACGITTTVTLPKLNTTDYKKTVSKAPTCTDTGIDVYEWKTSTYGSFRFTLTTEAKGHREAVDPAVAPTCTAEGLTEGKHCSVCLTVLTPREAVPARRHSYTYTKVDAMTHRLGCVQCDLQESREHSYTEGVCICGELEVKEPQLDPTIKIGHSLNLASDISVNCVVAKNLLAGFDMSTVYLLSTLEVYVGEEFAGTTTVRMEPLDKGSYYYFTLTGLTAVQMNDSISSVLYGTKDGQPYYSHTDVYTVGDYAYSQLANPVASDALKTLCADLLRYGARAQIYKGYRTHALADSKMTEAQTAYLSDIEAVTFGNVNKELNDLPNAPILWRGKSLDLDSKVCVKFVFDPSGYAGNLADLYLKVSYKDLYGEEMNLILTDPQDYNGKGMLYAFTLDTLLASELREPISVQIFHGNEPLSVTLQYSADTYGNNKTGTLLELCKALMAYSDSAKAYFNT